MKMYGKLIFLLFLVLLKLINGQSNDEKNYPIARFLTGRTSKTSFNTEFQQGRCPRRFYQSGDECLFFGTDGKTYSWREAARVCTRRIGSILNDASAPNVEQPNMQPTNGVRQLVLNTPEKTEILRAFYRDYFEQNFAVHLPLDYNTLQRCHDGQDDKWPHFCPDSQTPNSTCFETISHGTNDICLRQVECNKHYLRLACEFTLPGSPELTNSKFRNCSPARGRRGRRLPMWAWIAIIVGSALLLLLIIFAVFAFIRKSRGNRSPKKKFLPEPRRPDEKIIRDLPKREDPSAEPMLVRATPTNVPDSDYLQPKPSTTNNTANA